MLKNKQGANIHQTKLWLHTWNPFQGPQNLNLVAHKINLKENKNFKKEQKPHKSNFTDRSLREDKEQVHCSR